MAKKKGLKEELEIVGTVVVDQEMKEAVADVADKVIDVAIDVVEGVVIKLAKEAYIGLKTIGSNIYHVFKHNDKLYHVNTNIADVSEDQSTVSVEKWYHDKHMK